MDPGVQRASGCYEEPLSPPLGVLYEDKQATTIVHSEGTTTTNFTTTTCNMEQEERLENQSENGNNNDIETAWDAFAAPKQLTAAD
jgi:hypothetical protein